MDKDDYQKWLDMVKKEVTEVPKPETDIKVKQETDIKIESNPAKKTKLEPLGEDPPNKKEDLVKESDPLIDQFLSEIGDIKSEAFKTSSKEQLDRLLRPGSTYFNLNPFETLQIDPYCAIEEIRKKYRKLSMYVHPDKNPEDKERADIAFEAVNRSYKMLDDEKERKKCLEVVEEARERVDKTCEEKRKKLRREAVVAAALAAEKEKSKSKSSRFTQPESKPVSTSIEEDDPDKYRYAIYVMTCKLFADIERLKVREREKQQEEKKRKAEEKDHDAAKSKVKKEWDKNYEDSRQGRVSSWQNFARKPSDESPEVPIAAPVKTVKTAAAVPVKPKEKPVVKSKPALFFRPPKHKPETR